MKPQEVKLSDPSFQVVLQLIYTLINLNITSEQELRKRFPRGIAWDIKTIVSKHAKEYNDA